MNLTTLPCDRLIVPVMFYDAQYPPRVPGTVIPEELLITRDFICCQIANMAGSLSNLNPARIFCYNVLVYNYWDNPNFDEVYHLCCGLLLYRYQKSGLNNIRTSINECVYNVLNCYTAFLATNFSHVMKQLNVKQIEAVKLSIKDFQDMKAMVSSALKYQAANRLTDDETSDKQLLTANIIHKCKDLYVLDSGQLLEDCHYTHKMCYGLRHEGVVSDNKNTGLLNTHNVEIKGDDAMATDYPTWHPLNNNKSCSDLNQVLNQNLTQERAYTGYFNNSRPELSNQIPNQNAYMIPNQTPINPQEIFGYYIPDIPITQVIQMLPNNDRLIMTRSGQTVKQTFIPVNHPAQMMNNQQMPMSPVQQVNNGRFYQGNVSNVGNKISSTSKWSENNTDQTPIRRDEVKQQQVPETVVVKETLSLVEIKEPIMDRDRHIIKRFGGAIAYNINSTYVGVEASVNKLLDENPSDKLETSLSIEDTTDVDLNKVIGDIESHILYPDFKISTTLSQTIIDNKILALQHIKNSPSDKVFRSFGVTVNPIIMADNISEYFINLYNCDTVESLASEMTRLLIINTDSDYNKSILINALSQLNNNLTNKVNDFFKYRLRMDIKIDDFCEDISGIRAYLTNKYGKDCCVFFNAVEAEILNMFSIELPNEDIDYIKERLCLPSGIFLQCFPNFTSYTYVDLSIADLGLKLLQSNEAMSINLNNHSLLCKLANSLYKHKVQKKIITNDDIFEFNDGVQYKMHTNEITTNEFYLVRI